MNWSSFIKGALFSVLWGLLAAVIAVGTVFARAAVGTFGAFVLLLSGYALVWVWYIVGGVVLWYFWADVYMVSGYAAVLILNAIISAVAYPIA
jgi:hypothetical protein